MGSVYRLVDRHHEVAAAAMAIARTVAAKSAAAMRRLKLSLNNSTKAHELLTLYRAERSYTYELNILGDAAAGRTAFIDRTRESYAR